MDLREGILDLTRRHVWPPYTPLSQVRRDSTPLVIDRAQGVWLYDLNGKRYLDGISAWWTMTLGHNHPRLVRALREQSETLCHCALAGITHPEAALLARDLAAVAPPGLSHVFYTDNGSTSIEAAIKMTLQYWQRIGRPEKRRFVALEGAFHGESLGATSLGGVDVLRRPFASVVFDCLRVSPSKGVPQAFDGLRTLLEARGDEVAAVVLEPMVQGAAGMRMMPASVLQDARVWCDAHNVLLIVDEVFTGYGRTGPMWAVEHAGITPDLMCLGKAFAHLLPMGATLVHDRVFEPFAEGEALYYGHTYCGNPLGARLAREVLAIYKENNVLEAARPKAERIRVAFEKMRELPGVRDTRALGMVGALDLDASCETDEGYLSPLGREVTDAALRRGVWLRPLGHTVYVCPPLTLSDDELSMLLEAVGDAVAEVCQGRVGVSHSTGRAR